MKEISLQTKIIQLLENKGYWVVRVSSANKRGVPDVLAFRNGKFVAVEVKATESKKFSNLQAKCLETIALEGGYELCMYDVYYLKYLLEQIEQDKITPSDCLRNYFYFTYQVPKSHKAILNQGVNNE